MLTVSPSCKTLDNTISEIYQKIKKYEKDKKNISWELALQISSELLKKSSPQILECLNYLSLCPNGLSNSNLLQISEDWKGEEVGTLKEKSIITEKEIYVEDYIQSEQNEDNVKSILQKEDLSNFDFSEDSILGTVLDTVYKLQPWIREVLEKLMKMIEKEQYDSKIKEFMNTRMAKLLRGCKIENRITCSSLSRIPFNRWSLIDRDLIQLDFLFLTTSIFLVTFLLAKKIAKLFEAYEENLWAILDRIKPEFPTVKRFKAFESMLLESLEKYQQQRDDTFSSMVS